MPTSVGPSILNGLPGTSNNAPPPIPGGYGNPTGINNKYSAMGAGTSNSGGGAGFPSIPLYGPVTQGTPTTPAYNSPTFTGNMNGMNSGMNLTGDIGNHLLKELTDAYGKGLGPALFRILNKGLFNPQTADAMLNAQQPGIARGENDILSAFGDAGGRFGSASALGLGDYLSQVQLNQQATLAQMFEHAQDQQLGLLSGAMPTLHDENVNRDSSGIFGDILGGLEIAGGIASEFFLPGNPLGAGLITGGAGTIGAANGVGGGGSSSGGLSSSQLQGLINQIRASNSSTGAGGSGPFDGSSGGGIGSGGTIPLPSDIPVMSAGGVFGGVDPFAPNNDGGSKDSLAQIMMMFGMGYPGSGGNF